ALAAAPVEPVDELTKRRLIAAALEAAGPAVIRKRPWYQSPALAGGVAAAILALFAAVPFVTGGNDNNAGEQATASLEAASDLFLGDLGDLSDPAVLRDRFDSRRSLALTDRTGGGEADAAAGAETTEEAPKAASSSEAPPSPMASEPANNPAADNSAEMGGTDSMYSGGNSSQVARDEAAGGVDRTVADACARTLADGPARGLTLVALATGMYQDTPAVVAVFSGEGGDTAFVVDRDGCAVLTSYQI
ncbi:MAG: hypothetical protein ACRDZ3_03005, partial [Acidimicrobiia bacterium]